VKSAFVLALVLAACGNSGGGSGSGDDGIDGGGSGSGSGNGSVFNPAVKDVVLEIDYETGEEPYTGAIVGFGDTFDVTKTNLERIFSGTKTLTIPTTTAQMQDIGSVGDEELTVDDILALADAHRDTQSTSTKTAYYIVFVSGYFTDDNGPNHSVLGVSIGNTHVLAMFKDVIRSTSSPVFQNVVRYVEQSTLVHELGHAVGLVNNGIAMVEPHQDTAHGAHCTNDKCTMYWVNEGASSAAAFAQMYVTSGDSVIFGDECLADVDALTH
jgi:predicted Zn-dependent protease